MLEADPTIPKVDETGDQLLKHARVYTLAEKWGVDVLKNLASSKIHCVNSTAKGEIAYARYVYAYTPADDVAIRSPVASFWATRSHTLRSEAEEEFRSLCLEFPQFGYDVLSKSWPSSSVPGACALDGGSRELSACHGPCFFLLVVLTWRFSSARPRREAQARAQREAPSCHWQRTQATPSQQRLTAVGNGPLGNETADLGVAPKLWLAMRFGAIWRHDSIYLDQQQFRFSRIVTGVIVGLERWVCGQPVALVINNLRPTRKVLPAARIR